MNKPKMNVNIASMELINPIIGASGTFGNGLEMEDFLDLNKIGGFCSKGITWLPQEGNAGRRIAETPAGLLNSIGLQNMGIVEFIKNIVPQFRNKTDCKLIVNVSGKNVEQFENMAKMLELPEVAALELNLSCPNLHKDGIVMAADPITTSQVIIAVKKVSTKPIIVKLSPNVTDIKIIAKAAENAGADAISLINTVLGMAIDIKTAKPVLGNITGGLSGPAIKPIGVRMVWQVAETVKIPIIGLGGIETLDDCLEYLMAGATALQVGAANLYQPDICEKLAQELEDYCSLKGIQDYKFLIGKANPNFRGEIFYGQD
ncbi:MAG: dihydroorotate dehydrogenase [Clostridia bacterium]